MERIEGLVLLISSGKFDAEAIAGFVKASGGDRDVVAAAINSVKNFEGMEVEAIAGFVKASGGDRKVCLAAINSGKFDAEAIAGFVKASGGDRNVVAAACKFFKLS